MVSGTGVAHFMLENGVAARRSRSGWHSRSREREVLVLRLMQAVPGQLGALTRRMAEAEVNIEVLYSDHDHRLILVVDARAGRAVCGFVGPGMWVRSSSLRESVKFIDGPRSDGSRTVGFGGITGLVPSAAGFSATAARPSRSTSTSPSRKRPTRYFSGYHSIGSPFTPRQTIGSELFQIFFDRSWGGRIPDRLPELSGGGRDSGRVTGACERPSG